jgi:hypothetical protein
MKRRFIQYLCGVIFKHRPLSKDHGWAIGSPLCDRWCSRCGKMFQIPTAECDVHDPSFED